MPVKLIIIDNTLESQTREVSSVNLAEAVKQAYPVFHDGLYLYENCVSDETDITPMDAQGVGLIVSRTEGTYYLVNQPQAPALLLGALVLGAVAVATFLLLPKVPDISQRNIQSDSPNNSLSSRTNRARPNARIPDIFGTVRSTPDLISKPYTVFDNHQEIELGYYCVGRGSYFVPTDEVRDGTTPIVGIPGTSVFVYGPNSSPNTGEAAQVSTGVPINERVYTVYDNDAINGQELRAPNSATVSGAAAQFIFPNIIQFSGTSGIDDDFSAGDVVTISGASVSTTQQGTTNAYTATCSASGTVDIGTSPPYVVGTEVTLSNVQYTDSNGNIIDLSGTYPITSVSNNELTLGSLTPAWQELSSFTNSTTNAKPITVSSATTQTSSTLGGTYTVASSSQNQLLLSNPASVNTAWSLLSSGSVSARPTIRAQADKWVGPFIVGGQGTTKLIVNLVALNGLFKDDGETQFQENVTCTIEATPVDISGTPTGSTVTQTVTVLGSSTERSTRGATATVPVPSSNYVSVRVKRTSPTDSNFEGSVVDEIKWRNLYALSDPGDIHFGNVTTVQTRSVGNPVSLSLKERRLNLLVTRLINERQTDGTFTENVATNNAADIFMAAALDPFIGNRRIEELDVEDLYAAHQEVVDYFGTDHAGEFNYTFDKLNLSYQETAAIIAQAIFSSAYRRDNKISIFPELEVSVSSLLFNHRNKLPGTEQRSVSFGIENDYDGVIVSYVEPEEDAVTTVTVPPNTQIVNPLEIETLGVRTHIQAYFIAWRAYNKLLYQHISTSFTATNEVDLLNLKQAVLCTDNTRQEVNAGDVLNVDGLDVQLSQKHSGETGDTGTLYVQLSNATVQAINCTVVNENTVRLASAPSLPLVTGTDMYTRTLYRLAFTDTEYDTMRFLIAEKEPNGDMTTDVVFTNYDSRFYEKDKDYADGVIDLNLVTLP